MKFRDIYQCTPLAYRKKKQDRNRQADEAQIYEDIKKIDILPVTKYAIESNSSIAKVLRKDIEYVHCNIQRTKRNVWNCDSWKKVIGVGWAADILSVTLQSHIQKAQNDIGFEYARFQGIFDDDMMIYQEDADRNPIFNFVYSDLVLDFLQKSELKPYFELGMIPGLLAGSSMHWHKRPTHICMPNDWGKWDQLVEAFIKHCIQRYGLEQVRQWRFTPIMGNKTIAWFTMDEYLQMYHHVNRTLKQIDTNLIVGGPGMDVSIMLWDNTHPFEAFMDFCRTHNCMPDFISLQIYPYDFTKIDEQVFDIANPNYNDLQLSDDENFFAHAIEKCLDIIQRYNFNRNTLYIESWNVTISQNNPINDSCFKASYIVKNILENSDKAYCIAYWALSDYMSDLSMLQEKTFHGGIGLLTYDGLRKSGYHAMQLLSRLKGDIIHSAPGYSIMRNGDTIQIIAYQYSHYSNLSKQTTIMCDMDINMPYDACDPGHMQTRVFCLKGMPDEEYTVELFSIGKKQGGNPYDKWKEIGNPNPLTACQQDYLDRISSKGYRYFRQRTEDNLLEICCEIKPHDVFLFQISPAS
jgi:xylan 1,4-beta-xylosidase